MVDRAGRYRSLAGDAQRILRVLSVLCEPVGQQTLQKVLDALGWRDSRGLPLAQRMDRALRERLLAQGLIEQTRNGLTCHPDLLEPLARETVADGTFAAIAAAAERVVPTAPRSSWEQPSEERRQRRLRLALYGGQEAKVLELLGLDPTASASQVSFRTVELLARVCTRSPDPDWIARLGPRLQILALGPLLRESALDLVADRATYAVAERLLAPLAKTHKDAAEALAGQRLLRGRLGEVLPLLVGREDPEALALKGWWCFLRGDFAGTIASVEAAELSVRRQTRKRNLYTPGIIGALYLAALLQRGERADYERVQRQVAVCYRAPVTDPIAPVYRVLGDLVAVVAGQQRLEESYWLKGSLAGYGPFPTLFQALGIAWLGASVPGDLLPALALCAHQAAEAGLDWYAWEAVAVLRALGYQGGLPTLGEPPADLVLATRLLAPRAAWEIALEALQAVGAQTVPDQEGPAAGADRHLAWLLSLRGELATLEPRERRRTKGGVWTRGRPVALHRTVCLSGGRQCQGWEGNTTEGKNDHAAGEQRLVVVHDDFPVAGRGGIERPDLDGERDARDKTTGPRGGDRGPRRHPIRPSGGAKDPYSRICRVHSSWRVTGLRFRPSDQRGRTAGAGEPGTGTRGGHARKCRGSVVERQRDGDGVPRPQLPADRPGGGPGSGANRRATVDAPRS